MNRNKALKAAKPLAPMSAKRKNALAAAGVANPSSTFLPRQPPKTKSAKSAKPALKVKPATKKPTEWPVEFDQHTVDAILARDGYDCAMCGGGIHGVRGVDYSIHHRLLKSRGGDGRPSNGVTLCGHGTSGCHGLVHANVAWAEEQGWMVKSHEDPVLKPIPHVLHGFVYLDNGAGWSSRRPTNNAQEG